MSVPSRHSRRTVRTQRSACAFALGACGGVRTICTPSAVKTASNYPVYFVSRSRIRNRDWPTRFSEVVQQVRAGLNLVSYRQENQVGHQLDGVARRPVLASFLVVLLVEAPDQLLENRAHGVVIKTLMLTEPSLLSTDFVLRISVGSRNFSIRLPRASARNRRGIWLRNSKLSRIS